MLEDYVYTNPNPKLAEAFEAWVGMTPQSIFDMAERVQDRGQDLVSILKRTNDKLGGNMIATAYELCVPNPEGFNTMIHSDSWFNNMLFK